MAHKTKTTKARPPLLDLDTLVERATVIIDKKTYELRNPEELSILESHRLSRNGARMVELKERAVASDDLPDEEVVELTDQLAHLVGLILDAPEEVRARLSQVQQLAIVESFTTLQGERTQRTRRRTPRSAPPTRRRTGGR